MLWGGDKFARPHARERSSRKSSHRFSGKRRRSAAMLSADRIDGLFPDFLNRSTGNVVQPAPIEAEAAKSRAARKYAYRGRYTFLEIIDCSFRFPRPLAVACMCIAQCKDARYNHRASAQRHDREQTPRSARERGVGPSYQKEGCLHPRTASDHG
jgi:hypothetical protein